MKKLTIADKTCMSITLEPGWKWSESVGPNMPSGPMEKCPGTHFGIIMKGALKMTHDDGTVVVAKAGDAYYCGPGHLAEVEGDEQTVMVEFSQQLAQEYKEVTDPDAPAAEGAEA